MILLFQPMQMCIWTICKYSNLPNQCIVICANDIQCNHFSGRRGYLSCESGSVPENNFQEGKMRARAHRQAHDGQPRLQDKIVWQDNGDTPVEQWSPKSQQACLLQSLYICNPAVEAKFALVHDCSTILSPFSLLSHLSKYLVFYSCAMSLSKRNHFHWKYTLNLNNFNKKKNLQLSK